MLKLTYRPKTATKLRLLFTLHAGGLGIPGQIYERPEGKDDRYFWNFCGKFPWDVGDTLPPFRFVDPAGRDLSALLFYGIPQALLKVVYDFEPAGLGKYAVDTNRNCANCEFAVFDHRLWEDRFTDQPIASRFDEPPSHLYRCGVSGEFIDHVAPVSGSDRSSARRQRDLLRNSLRENACSAHSRRAYQVATGFEARGVQGADQRWVPSETRRLRGLNPKAIHIDGLRSLIELPFGITIKYGPEAES